MKLKELINYTGQLLQVDRYRDYCPNGLQVEGRGEVGTIVSGVSASMALLEAAAGEGADLILVHHGYFWKNEEPCITGIKRLRLKYLLEKSMSMAAYHLPLDAHQDLGNNARLAGVLGFTLDGWGGDQSMVAYGRPEVPMTLSELGVMVDLRLGRRPLIIGDPDLLIRRVAWCTGAAQDALELAVEMGVDAFITGEVSERTVHLSRESGVAFIAAGHHATERYGIQALGEHLAARFGLRHFFVDIDNPV